jgi:imidazolonepropionase-like amidohydrolase/Tol biopolymer transport system component
MSPASTTEGPGTRYFRKRVCTLASAWTYARFLFFVMFAAPGGVGAETEEADQGPSWSVDKPAMSAPATLATIDTREGTWMSVDVSPDGRRLVFDLLGDLYLLDIEGGQARSLTQGMAWDIQPRFSPDGSEVAFVSDREGGDNIWVITLDSGETRQISFESFRLLNSPVWHPSGDFIAAKKHFTTSRSLGTGEIWLYESNSQDKTSGVRLVKRPNENYQKELGEPAFSSDGKSLFYTQSASPGNTFIYHEDSHGGLFEIKRLNLEDGETDTVVGGFGGAVRAVPSPSGDTLAFVKRIRTESKLFLIDLKSQKQRLIADDLDPDMQETWGVYGLYPNMAWSPEGAHIIYWAGGQLRRVAVATGETQDIAFRVQAERQIYTPPQPSFDVFESSFRTKMVRYARSNPSGERFIFESLGELFVKSLDGQTRPLFDEKRDDHAFSPVYQSGGDRLYFLTWSDTSLGSMWSVAENGSQVKKLPLPPGHYVDLELSADDRFLVYRKLSGSDLTHPDWGQAPGIYVYDLEQGVETKISKDGFGPHFGPGNRVFYTHRNWSAEGRGSDGGALTVLYSRDVLGQTPRQHARGALIRQFWVSPSGEHIAFIENYQLYLAKSPALGVRLDLSANFDGLSVEQLSADGATDVAWSKDGQRLGWSMGAKRYEQTVTFERSGFDESTVVDLSQAVKSDQPSGMVALVGGRILTMDAHNTVIENGIIVIENNRIVGVGHSGGLNIPKDATRVDVTGKTLIPGLIDAHAHGPYGRSGILPQNNWSLLAHLALGVTTIHNPSSQARQVFAAAEYQRSGKILGPRIFSTGNVVYGAKSLGYAVVDDLDDALAHVRRLKAQGAISIKNYNQPRREQRQQVIEAARQEGLLVVAEGASLFHQDMNLIADGASGIEHNIPTLKIYDDVVQFWRQSKTGYTPTLVVTYGGLTAEDYYYQHTEVWKHRLLSRFVPPGRLQARSVRRVMAPEVDFKDDDAAAAAYLLAQEGVTVNTGAHGQREGLATHWELWSFVRGGFPPMDALKLATINPARYLGLSDSIGSLEVGKLADLVILNQNPLEDIHHTEDIDRVMLNGRLFEAETMAETVTGDRPAVHLWWYERPELDSR